MMDETAPELLNWVKMYMIFWGNFWAQSFFLLLLQSVCVCVMVDGPTKSPPQKLCTILISPCYIVL